MGTPAILAEPGRVEHDAAVSQSARPEASCEADGAEMGCIATPASRQSMEIVETEADDQSSAEISSIEKKPSTGSPSSVISS